MSPPEEREGEDGPPERWEDATERTLDIPQEAAGVEDQVPDTNSSTNEALLQFLVWELAYGILDHAVCFGTAACATDITDAQVNGRLELFVDPLVPFVLGCSDQAVSATMGGDAQYEGCPVPVTP